MMHKNKKTNVTGRKTVPVNKAVGMVLAHDITEIRRGEFKGRAFKKGHIIREEDISHLQRLGKENLFVLDIKESEMHEDDAAYAIARALAGDGVKLSGEPSEGKINLIAAKDGLLKVNRDALAKFNALGEVMCATMHNNSIVKKGRVVAGTRAIPLVVKKSVVEKAVAIAKRVQQKISPYPPLLKGGWGDYRGTGIIEVKEIRKPKAGIVITGNEVYYGRIKDAFAPIITKKIKAFHGEIVGIHYAPDDEDFIEKRLRELLEAGADLLITTGGMSVDPDDVTRFAIRNIGVTEMYYGSAVLPGAMFLVAYLQKSEVKNNSKLNPSFVPRPSSVVPVLGIPACGMYSNITIFDLILPRILAGEKIRRRELAELGHGGLCLQCKKCHYPVCPFGK